MYNQKRISVIIPALNEENSVAKVIKDIPAGLADEIIVVDNGSTDNTAEKAKSVKAKVIREPTPGYGLACRRGIEAADENYDVIVILDADYSDFPQQMPRLLDPIVEGSANLVIGSRVLGNRQKGALAPQVFFGNRLATFLIELFFGFKFTDMGPFRAIDRQSLKSLKMQDAGYGWNVEMQIKAIKNGLKIKEVAVDYRKRIGKSKISGTIAGTIGAGYKIIATILRYGLALNRHCDER